MGHFLSNHHHSPETFVDYVCGIGKYDVATGKPIAAVTSDVSELFMKNFLVFVCEGGTDVASVSLIHSESKFVTLKTFIGVRNLKTTPILLQAKNLRTRCHCLTSFSSFRKTSRVH